MTLNVYALMSDYDDLVPHVPVMCKEAISRLNLRPGKLILDCTVGCGGHAYEILRLITPGGKLIGIDQDKEALLIAEDRLKEFKGSFVLAHGNFENFDEVLGELKIEKIDGVIFDLGLSSFQLEVADRGFSIKLDGQLDMRMDRAEMCATASELVNRLSQRELVNIFEKFGEERWSNRIAQTIINSRKASPIFTTAQLTNIVMRAIPHHRGRTKIHPATRVFQALRIAVNHELEVLDNTLQKIVSYLNSGARMCVISFHSLEDRIVKNKFRNFYKEGKLQLITPKPVTPTFEEIKINPRCRSAKLRVVEKI